MNYIKFSHDYEKLKDRLFTTIRRYDRYPDVDEEVPVKTPSSSFTAIIVFKTMMELENISTSLLCYDTGKATREEAVGLLQSFYRKPIASYEPLTILYLLKKEDKK